MLFSPFMFSQSDKWICAVMCNKETLQTWVLILLIFCFLNYVCIEKSYLYENWQKIKTNVKDLFFGLNCASEL